MAARAEIFRHAVSVSAILLCPTAVLGTFTLIVAGMVGHYSSDMMKWFLPVGICLQRA
jgi:hypothetical protein